MGDRKFALLFSKNVILILGRAFDRMTAIGVVLHEAGGHFLGKEDLPDVRSVTTVVGLAGGVAAHADLVMNMVGAAHVDAGKDGAKTYRSVCTRALDAAQEGLVICWCVIGRRPHRRSGWTVIQGVIEVGFEVRWRPGRSLRTLLGEAGVDAGRIAMPYIDGRIRQRFAGACVEQSDLQNKRHTRFMFSNIRAKQLAGNVVRAYFLLRCQLAGRGLHCECVCCSPQAKRSRGSQAGAKEATAG